MRVEDCLSWTGASRHGYNSWGLQNRSHQDQKEDAYRLLGIAAMMHPRPRFVA